MALNKQKGNMYPFVSHTWNPIRGKCPHDCRYCYMKVYPQPELYFVEKEMGTNLGFGNFIFVGSSTDMWCVASHVDWIKKTLQHCREYGIYNRYLFQSKNPSRFNQFRQLLPDKSILGTTIETNRDFHGISKAPIPFERMMAMLYIERSKMVSIEPIMDFDLEVLLSWIKSIEPEFVSIGADSKGHKLPEPNPEKIHHLINELQKETTIKIKSNLKRLLV